MGGESGFAPSWLVLTIRPLQSSSKAELKCCLPGNYRRSQMNGSAWCILGAKFDSASGCFSERGQSCRQKLSVGADWMAVVLESDGFDSSHTPILLTPLSASGTCRCRPILTAS